MALTTERKQYIENLAKPRPLPVAFSDNRRSVYWENGIQPKDYSRITEIVLTPRQESLVHPKQRHREYKEDRPSPIWKINRATLEARSTPRLCALATPKKLHPNYQYPKEVHPPIPTRVLSARPSARISQLARHKTYPSLPIKPNSEWEWGAWPSDVTPATLSATPSSYIEALSQPKKLSQLYQPNRSVHWPIPAASLQYIATDRLQRLACPKEPRGYQKDYNPKTWSVSRAALQAQASPCIENLAKPLPRKCRQKRNI